MSYVALFLSCHHAILTICSILSIKDLMLDATNILFSFFRDFFSSSSSSSSLREIFSFFYYNIMVREFSFSKYLLLLLPAGDEEIRRSNQVCIKKNASIISYLNLLYCKFYLHFVYFSVGLMESK